MVPGFNHNIKYKGRIYHVQTEDNGAANPYIATHIFLGGNILASRRTSYQDIVLNENAPQIIEEMMKEQHKAMVKELIHGALDDKLTATPPAPKTAIPLQQKAAATTLDADKAKKSEQSLDEIILDYLAKEKPVGK